MKFTRAACWGLAALCLGAVDAAEPQSVPLPTPLTRPEMKQALEDLKDRKIRIPLPELTDEDKAMLGDRAGSYESRLRHHYLPRGDEQRAGSRGPGSFTRQADANVTLSYEFKTMLFWIVSRTNNCLY